MNYNHPDRHSSTTSIRLVCATVFMVFSFCWLYFFQADVMAAAQHVLSGGRTHYNALVGAVLITLCLQALQLLVFAFIRLRKRSHALTYLPSLLLLAVLTDVSPDIDRHFSLGAWWWVFPLVIVLWLVLALLARGLQDIEPEAEPCGLFSRPMWINLLQLLVMLLAVAAVSNTNAVFHYRMRMESALLRGDAQSALNVGNRSLESDANLQMLRMYALARTGEMGERLFTYPIVAGSSAMLPTAGESRTILLPADSIYRYLGARPASKMLPMRYLQLLEQRDTVVSRCLADYELCGLLIDKQMDAFVSRLCQFYAVGDSLNTDALPRHYREALTLYTHLRSTPRVVYHDAVMDEDWDNLQELEHQYPDATERRGKVEEQYRGTYWYYFEYE